MKDHQSVVPCGHDVPVSRECVNDGQHAVEPSQEATLQDRLRLAAICWKDTKNEELFTEAADALDTLKTLTRYPWPETGQTYNDGYCRGYNAALAVVKSIVEGDKS